jgi:hypothetical protein
MRAQDVVHACWSSTVTAAAARRCCNAVTACRTLQDILAEHLHDVVGDAAALRLPRNATIRERNGAVSRLLRPDSVSRFRGALAANGSVAFVVGAASDGGDKKDHAASAGGVALHSCLGIWPGCVARGAPALQYHHGTQWGESVRGADFLARFHVAIASALRQWLAVLDDASLA